MSSVASKALKPLETKRKVAGAKETSEVEIQVSVQKAC